MKLYYFSSLIFQAFKNHAWGKVTNIRQTSNGWAFVIEDTLNGDSYLCCAYPLKKQEMPNTVDEFLAMTKEKSND